MAMSERSRGDLVTGLVAFVARAAVVLWASGRFPPAADGVYYHAIAVRVAQGLGSTWLWPDGKVTYAAHYPVGYPALLSLGYRLAGASPDAGAWVNALLGTAAAVAIHRLALSCMGPRRALGAGLAVALHPGLLMYTPALMTEGVTAALLAIAAWTASLRSRRGLIALGLVMGVATLVRPQSLVLAPCLGIVALGGSRWERLRGAAIATCLALLVCAPWTIRNCVRMHRCALVSVNGGWNLLIGAAEEANGAWAPIKVPKSCETVWDEAEKDACFEREARRLIASSPARWVGLVPARLAATFDYAGAPGFYLHASNPEGFGDRAKVALGAAETIFERLTYLGALVFAGLAPGPRRKARLLVAVVAAVLLFQLHAYLGVLGLAIALGLLGRSLIDGPVLPTATFFVLLATAAVHAAFFGAGRYAMVAFPLVTALAFAALTPGEEGRDTGAP
jgi:hypothetical protein